MKALSTNVNIKLNNFEGNFLAYVICFCSVGHLLCQPNFLCPQCCLSSVTLFCSGKGPMKPWAWVCVASPYLCGNWNLSLGLQALIEMSMDLSPWVPSWSLSCGYPVSHHHDPGQQMLLGFFTGTCCSVTHWRLQRLQCRDAYCPAELEA